MIVCGWILVLWCDSLILPLVHPKNKRSTLEKKIAQAQTKKAGIWSQGKARTSAADFKRNGGAVPVPVASARNNQHVLQSSTAHNKRAVPAVAYNKRDKSRQGKLLDTAVTGLEFAS